MQHRKWIISMLKFLIDNTFVVFGGTFVNKSSVSLWDQAVPLSLPIFSYTPILLWCRVYTNFSKTNKIQKLKHIIAFFQILILLNGFYKYAPKELEIKETTETAPSTSFLDIFLKSDTNWSTRLYDKREDFYFAIRKLILKCQPLPCMKLTFHNS